MKAKHACSVDGCDRTAVAKGMCDKHYRRMLRHGATECSRHVGEGDEVARFHQKYVKHENGCWLWIAGTRPNSKGVLYGRHCLDDGGSEGAHRFSYRVHKGDPAGLLVCHTCDTPLCVNPEHLFLGTHNDNMADMVAKGRSDKSRGAAKWGRAKLTEFQAAIIRGSGLTQQDLAAAYGVAQTTVSRVRRGESYCA